MASDAPERISAQQQTWRGASGRDYVHSVYGLIECPPLPKSTYVLARREADGRLTTLHIGVGRDDAETLNLARVRQRGAQLGANEVHVYLGARSEAARALAACDLRAGQFGQLGSERNASAPCVPSSALKAEAEAL
jgi:hypothetical protein